MKTKLQFIALASLAVMGAGCLAVTTGIIANEKEELSINAEPLKEQGTGFFIPGNSVYFALNPTLNWASSNAKFAICYGVRNGSIQNTWTGFMTKVSGYDYPSMTANPKYDLYEITVPEAEGLDHWDFAILGRFSSDAANGTFVKAEGFWNKSADLNYWSDNTQNLAKIDSNSDDWNNPSVGWDLIKPEDRINVWGLTTEWWGENAEICQQDGNTDLTNSLAPAWNASAKSFNALGYDVRSFFSNNTYLDASNTSSGHYNSLAQRYDYIASKYKSELNNFANRQLIF